MARRRQRIFGPGKGEPSGAEYRHDLFSRAHKAAKFLSAFLLDVKGDIFVATAADTVARLPAGANGTVLKANSTTTTGLEWGTVSGGGGGGSADEALSLFMGA